VEVSGVQNAEEGLFTSKSFFPFLSWLG